MNVFRVLRTLFAHGYGQAITITSTLVIPSVAVSKWGAVGFGYWVTLSALAQFFMMSDLGASTALANQLCLKVNRSSEDAWDLTQSVIKDFMKKAVIFFGIILLVTVFIAIFYSREIETKNAILLALTFLSLAFAAMIQPVQAVYSAAWRFIGRNEIGIFLLNTTRIIDVGIIVGVAILGGQMLLAAAFVTLIKLLTVWGIYVHMPYLVMQKKKFILDNMKRSHVELDVLNKAGHGFTIISLSQQLTLHGPVMIISVLLGPLQAAIFAACRTLSRLPVQPLTVLLASLNPELTELIANKNYKQLKVIVRKVLSAVIIISIFVGVSSVIFMRTVQKYWLDGRLNLDINILIPLCIAATFYLCGQVINQTLLATNETREQSKQFMLISFIMIIIMIPLLWMTRQAMWGAIVVLIAESAMTMLLLRRYFSDVTVTEKI